mmetsp:Transcript_22478/g.31265  ORF Transcript_22478/g.31265 Transcript_22478/m.31265 type:complete len:339 (+) Transcript_22478:115-1131(+)
MLGVRICVRISPTRLHNCTTQLGLVSKLGLTPPGTSPHRRVVFSPSHFRSFAYTVNSSFQQLSSSLSRTHKRFASASASHTSHEAEKGDSLGNQFRVWKNGGGQVHCDADVDPSAVVEIGAVVHAGAKIAGLVLVGSGSVVGPAVSVGANTVLHYNVALSHCDIGESCIFHHGVCLGQDGFGFLVDPKTGEVVKKPQELRVLVGSHVEIGAGSCVDRGSWRDTTIGDHTKIDNLVQIGHNVHIGKCCFLCGHVALGGSCTLGDYVVLAGKSAVKDHIKIVSQVRVAAKSGVINDITAPGDYAGFPALPAREWRRQIVEARRRDRFLNRVDLDQVGDNE